MAKLNIPKNYLDLTLDELINSIFDKNCIKISSKIHKPDDYEKVIHKINEILEESFQMEFLSASENEEDENQWIFEIGVDEIVVEFTLYQEEDKIEDRGLVNGINQLFNKLKTGFSLFSYWDSEWDSHKIGFGLVSNKSKKDIQNIINSRKENDWFELFYISE